MKHPKSTDDTNATPDGVPHSFSHAGTAAGAGVGAASGAAAGAAIGAFAGPVGAVAGALIGASVGAATGAAIAEDNHDHEVHDHHLDEECGVTSGDLGAADPNQPPAKRGTYSMGAAGGGSAGGAETTQDAGPMPHGE